jgi:hypothetical protein
MYGDENQFKTIKQITEQLGDAYMDVKVLGHTVVIS